MRLRSEQIMDYTAADVNKLREEAGATFADCKNALAGANGWDDAVKYLEKRSGHKAEKMMAADRETKEGGVFSYVHHNHRVGVLLELNCSTDFVALSESFRGLAKDVTQHIAGLASKYVNYDGVPAEVVEEGRKRSLGGRSLGRITRDKRVVALEG